MELRYLTNTLHSIRARWKVLSTQLEIEQGDIEAIDEDNNNVEDCFRESLKIWLKRVNPEPTRTHLAGALKNMNREDLAKQILQENIEAKDEQIQEQLTSDPSDSLSSLINSLFFWSGIIMWLVAMILLGGVAFFSVPNSLIQPPSELSNLSRSLSLPKIKQQLVGRREEVSLLVDYLRDDNVEVVVLFGSPGFGKSEIAKHVGHEMNNLGSDVHYIRVEDFKDIDGLTQRLMDISEVRLDGLRLMKWAKNLTRKTILILDNVDGPHWLQDKLRPFRDNFVDVLLSQTFNLTILITSQQEIRFMYKYISRRLFSLSCIELMNISVQGPRLLLSESESICGLVGNVPLAVKVLAASLSPSLSAEYMIERLSEKSMKLKFLARSADRVDKDRLLKAFDLAFKSLKPEYQACSLVLVTFPGLFSLDMMKSLFADEKYFTSDFRIEECLHELSLKSFIELIEVQKQFFFDEFIHKLSLKYFIELIEVQRQFYFDECIQLSLKSFIELIEVQRQFYFDGTMHVLQRYNFHILIRDFLISTRDSNHDNGDVINIFWESSLAWLNSKDGSEWLLYNIGKEDVDVLTEIIDRFDNYSYTLALYINIHPYIGLLRNVVYNMKSLWAIESRYRILLYVAANTLVGSDCSYAGWAYPTHNVPLHKVIDGIVSAFKTLILLRDEYNIMDKLQLCANKLELLQSMYSNDINLHHSISDFYHLINYKCDFWLQPKNSHDACKSGWRRNIILLGRMLAMVWHRMMLYCNSTIQASEELNDNPKCNDGIDYTDITIGLGSYANMNDAEAIGHIYRALLIRDNSSCMELYYTISYITLYSICARNKGNEIAEVCQEIDIVSLIDIVASIEPSNMTCYTAIYDDIVIPFFEYLNETDVAVKLSNIQNGSYSRAKEKCKDRPHCFNARAYKYPSFLDFTRKDQIWVEDLSMSDTSLFCSVIKDVMEGCESPFVESSRGSENHQFFDPLWEDLYN